MKRMWRFISDGRDITINVDKIECFEVNGNMLRIEMDNGTLIYIETTCAIPEEYINWCGDCDSAYLKTYGKSSVYTLKVKSIKRKTMFGINVANTEMLRDKLELISRSVH